MSVDASARGRRPERHRRPGCTGDPTRAIGLLLLLGLAASAPSAGRAEVARVDAAEEGCPRRDAVERRLAELLPLDGATRETNGSGGAVAGTDRVAPGTSVRITVIDRGSAFFIRAGGVEREFLDVSRDCVDRANTAALFGLLALYPPAVAPAHAPAEPITFAGPATLAPPSPPPVTSAPPAAPSLPSSSRPPRASSNLRVDLELGPALEWAPGGADNPLVNAAAGARFAFSGRNLGASFGVGAGAPTTLQLQAVSLSLSRIPIDAGFRASLTRGRVELAGELGIAATIVIATGQHLATNETQTGANLGVRVAGLLRIRAGARWTPYAGISAIVDPVPAVLTVGGRGAVGSTPRVWLAGTVGVAIRLY